MEPHSNRLHIPADRCRRQRDQWDETQITMITNSEQSTRQYTHCTQHSTSTQQTVCPCAPLEAWTGAPTHRTSDNSGVRWGSVYTRAPPEAWPGAQTRRTSNNGDVRMGASVKSSFRAQRNRPSNVRCRARQTTFTDKWRLKPDRDIS